MRRSAQRLSRVSPGYNTEHHHAGLGLLTPATVHHGQADAVRAHRHVGLTTAYAAQPERFVRKPPAPPALPTAVWINPPPAATAATAEVRQYMRHGRVPQS